MCIHKLVVHGVDDLFSVHYKWSKKLCVANTKTKAWGMSLM